MRGLSDHSPTCWGTQTLTNVSSMDSCLSKGILNPQKTALYKCRYRKQPSILGIWNPLGEFSMSNLKSYLRRHTSQELLISWTWQNSWGVTPCVHWFSTRCLLRVSALFFSKQKILNRCRGVFQPLVSPLLGGGFGPLDSQMWEEAKEK